MKGANNSYFGNIRESITSLTGGLKLTFKHLWQARESRKPIGVEDDDYFSQETGVITLQYPFESFPVPDNGRYRLHNEIDDCIVCDKCAKVCPVNCIDIEPVKAVEEMGLTSDGTKKRIHAAKFDIDMAKCCFCGLCTTVCPTECLTMTKAYDFSEFDVKDHNYAFSEMTPIEILEKKKALEEVNATKTNAIKTPVTATQETPKAKFKPRVKGVVSKAEENQKTENTSGQDMVSSTSPKPKFRPKIKSPKSMDSEANPDTTAEPATPKPKFRPKIKGKSTSEKDVSLDQAGESAEIKKPKPVFRPKVKKTDTDTTDEIVPEASAKPKPKFRPKIKPKIKKDSDESGSKNESQD